MKKLTFLGGAVSIICFLIGYEKMTQYLVSEIFLILKSFRWKSETFNADINNPKKLIINESLSGLGFILLFIIKAFAPLTGFLRQIKAYHFLPLITHVSITHQLPWIERASSSSLVWAGTWVSHRAVGNLWQKEEAVGGWTAGLGSTTNQRH